MVYLDELKNRDYDEISVNMIVAVGKNREIGLNGDLPWKNNSKYKFAMEADLKDFKELTRGCVVVVGRNTWPSIKHLDGTYNRLFLIDGADTFVTVDKTKIEVPWDFWIPKYMAYQRYNENKFQHNPIVWIAGGAKTYEKWWPYLDSVIIHEIGYEGPADTYLPEYMVNAQNPITYKTYYY